MFLVWLKFEQLGGWSCRDKVLAGLHLAIARSLLIDNNGRIVFRVSMLP